MYPNVLGEFLSRGKDLSVNYSNSWDGRRQETHLKYTSKLIPNIPWKIYCAHATDTFAHCKENILKTNTVLLM